MKIIKPGFEILTPLNGKSILQHIEAAGRVCYKSESKITDTSCYDFVKKIIARGHEAVLEHYSFSVKFVCDRGVSHEIVRHRLASYCQESTRYCNYSKECFDSEITVIRPTHMRPGMKDFEIWEKAMNSCENAYFDLLDYGCTPQEARSVLPNSLKTEVVMTADMREWRHFIRLRCAPAAHPDMRVVAGLLYDLLKSTYPVFFEDIEVG